MNNIAHIGSHKDLMLALIERELPDPLHWVATDSILTTEGEVQLVAALGKGGEFIVLKTHHHKDGLETMDVRESCSLRKTTQVVANASFVREETQLDGILCGDVFYWLEYVEHQDNPCVHNTDNFDDLELKSYRKIDAGGNIPIAELIDIEDSLSLDYATMVLVAASGADEGVVTLWICTNHGGVLTYVVVHNLTQVLWFPVIDAARLQLKPFTSPIDGCVLGLTVFGCMAPFTISFSTGEIQYLDTQPQAGQLH